MGTVAGVTATSAAIESYIADCTDSSSRYDWTFHLASLRKLLVTAGHVCFRLLVVFYLLVWLWVP
jgi:hypothetical protein